MRLECDLDAECVCGGDFIRQICLRHGRITSSRKTVLRSLSAKSDNLIRSSTVLIAERRDGNPVHPELLQRSEFARRSFRAVAVAVAMDVGIVHAALKIGWQVN